MYIILIRSPVFAIRRYWLLLIYLKNCMLVSSVMCVVQGSHMYHVLGMEM